MQDHDPINLLLRAATTSKQLNSSPNVGSARYYGFSGSAVASRADSRADIVIGRSWARKRHREKGYGA